jgi:hypothetical protein
METKTASEAYLSHVDNVLSPANAFCMVGFLLDKNSIL